MSVLSVNLGAVELEYFALSGFELNTSNDYNFPLFTAANFENGPVNTDFPAKISPYSVSTSTPPVFSLLSTNSMGGLVSMPTPPTSWATSDLLQQSYTVTSDVYFASQFRGTPPVAPTLGTQDKSNWTIYLTMASGGPYILTFTAEEVGGTKASLGRLAPGMTAAGWVLAASQTQDCFDLTYTGPPTMFAPCITLKRDDNSDSIAYLRVTLCRGFGIQMISSFSAPTTNPDFSVPVLSPCPKFSVPVPSPCSGPGLSKAAIGGIAASGVVLVAAVVCLAVLLCMNKSRLPSVSTTLPPVPNTLPPLLPSMSSTLATVPKLLGGRSNRLGTRADATGRPWSSRGAKQYQI